MSEKEAQVESKETPHLVNMDLDTIISMVNRVASEYMAAGAESTKLASELSDKELFNLFFALDFLFNSEEGGKSLKDLTNETEAMFLYATLQSQLEIRTGLTYDGNGFITTL
jgi:hypothetical protein